MMETRGFQEVAEIVVILEILADKDVLESPDILAVLEVKVDQERMETQAEEESLVPSASQDLRDKMV